MAQQTVPAIANSTDASSNTCPACYDCQNLGCGNYGTCVASKGCTCPLGFGGPDCWTPVCNSTNVANDLRALRPTGQTCKCDVGFAGVN
ncbi:hypothetical protein HDU76_006874, partial [Blyttiomyces sp. JEL0837]